MLKEKIIIIGAGPAGLSCAYELDKAGFISQIYEKEDCVGGFSKTLIFKEGVLFFKTDIGPHRFFSKQKYLYDMIKEILGDDWVLVKRKTRQFIDGKFYDYPIKAFQAFKNIGIVRAIKMLLSYLYATIRFRFFRKEVKNFDDYIVSNFGRSLGEFNMLNYTEKIWGISCKKIHPDWAKQRIKGLNLISALKNALFQEKKDSPKSLVDSFFYPKNGTGQIYETISEKIQNNGSDIKLKSFPKKIFHKDGLITSLDINVDGRIKTIIPKTVVNSIPITDFIMLLSPKPPQEVLKAVQSLNWRSQVYLFITLNKDYVTRDNWIYFPDKEIPFARVSEMKNFQKSMSPENKTSLFIEFFCSETDDIWSKSKEELFDMVFPFFSKNGFFKKEDVRNYYSFKKKYAYPIYDLDYLKHLNIIKKYLDTFKNLYYIGRPGRYKYNNQDHSLEMGITAARSIIDNKRYDLDKIGSEDEYFEKGVIK
jgi:protoporphyrinogen oxidase